MEANQKYKYLLSGNPAGVKKVAKEVLSVSGVVSAELGGDNVLEVLLDEHASEYDVFCAINDVSEKYSVDVDYAEDEEDPETSDEEALREDGLAVDTSEGDETPKMLKPDNSEVKKLPDDEKSWKVKYIGHFAELLISAVLIAIVHFASFTTMAETFMCLIAFAVVGYEIIWDAVVAILKKDYLNHNIPIVIATVVLLFVSSYLEAAFIAFLFQLEIVVIKVLTGISEEKLKKRLDYSYLILKQVVDGEETDVFAKDVTPGNVIKLQAGNTVPFDCCVDTGSAVISESNVTLENNDFVAAEGAFIHGGCVVKSGDITVIAKSSMQDSLAAKVYSKLRTAAETEYSKKVKKYSSYTLVGSFLICAILAFLVPVFLKKDGNYVELMTEWSYIAVGIFALCNALIFPAAHYILWRSAVNRTLSQGSVVNSVDRFIEIGNAKSVAFKNGSLLEEAYKADKILPAPEYKGKVSKVLSSFGLKPSALIGISGEERNNDSGALLVGDGAFFASKGIIVKEISSCDEIRYIALGGNYVGAVTFTKVVQANAYGAIKELSDSGISSVVEVGKDGTLYEGLDDVAALSEVAAGADDTIQVSASDPNAHILYGKVKESCDLTNGVIIPEGDVKAVAKTVKLAKRFNKLTKVGAILPIVGKIIAIALCVVLHFVLGKNSVWIAVAVDTCICMLSAAIALLGGRDVY